MVDTIALDARADKQQYARLLKPMSLDRAEVTRAIRQGPGLKSVFKLQFGPGKLSADEFVYYGLHRRDPGDQALSEYAGMRAYKALHGKCNDPTWFASCDNKLLFSHIMHGAALPHPELLASLPGGSGREIWNARTGLYEPLREFLLGTDHYPMFAKPIGGMFSIGALHLTGKDGDQIQLSRQRQIHVDALIDYMYSLDMGGYLFQSVLEPCGENGLAALRIMILLNDGVPAFHSATLKLPGPEQDADNLWRAGNLVAPVDMDSGLVGAALASDFGLEDSSVETPATPALPAEQWNMLKTTLLQAARLFPGIRTQGWDVALTREGPVILELNFGGDMNLYQLAHGKGLLDERFCQHVRRCGYRGKLPYH